MTHFEQLFELSAILFIGFFGAHMMRPYGIPQVLGFILSGIILSGIINAFDVVTFDSTDLLGLFAVIALGFIGFNIGAELRWEELKKIDKKLFFVLLVDSLGTFVIVTFFIYWFTSLNLVFSLIVGSLSSATAPAATADVLWEYKSQGPLTQAILFILAFDDIIAILLVLISLELAFADVSGTTVNVTNIVEHFFYEVGVAILIGVLAGLIIVSIVNRTKDHGEILVLIFGAIILVISISSLLEVSSILACMIFGIILASMSDNDTTETFHDIFKLGSPFVAMFFIVIGLSITLGDLRLLTGIGLVYLFSRGFGKIVGVGLAARYVGVDDPIQRYLGISLMSQAGVALGLAAQIYHDFQGSTTEAAETAFLIFSTITATTIILQIIGPIMVKWAIHQSGEVPPTKLKAAKTS